MKKHTNEEIMKFFDIRPGDRFEYEGEVYTAEEIINFTFYLNCQNGKNLAFTTCEEVQEKIKELPRLVKVGDMQCSPTNCDICPLRFLSCHETCGGYGDSIFTIYHLWSKSTGYTIPELEKLLNKEVPEN